jgi:hypothetical protein
MLTGSDICRSANQDLGATGMIVTMAEMIVTMEMTGITEGAETAMDVSKCSLQQPPQFFGAVFLFVLLV